MKQIIATVVKEWQLMKRDISGLLLLLAMPAAMIIVMAIVEDAPYKDYQEQRFELLLSDNDHGSLARQIIAGLKQSKHFYVVDSIGGIPLTDESLKQQLNTGKYKIGIVIPNGVTAEVVNAANIIVNDISQKTGMEAHLPARDAREDVYIRLYFDPVSKPAFRSAIGMALDKQIAYSTSGILMQRLSTLSRQPGPTGDSTQQPDLRKVMQGISVKEEPLNDKGKSAIQVSSVQHNVPAWAIFGMFFISIPIAGRIIREREDGSALRVGLIPGAGSRVALGKIIFYTLVCMMQFVVMLAIGMWTMPWFGLPVLNPGPHPWVLAPISVCIGFVATGYGFFIGTLFRTVIQALPSAGVSIVIMSALGGIWVPVEILPHSMQMIAMASPMHWALQAINQVILRNGNFQSVLLPMGILVCFGTLLWIASVLTHHRHQARA